MEILQIVLARPTDLDSLGWHRTELLEPISQAQPFDFARFLNLS
jgi:hypothetical protein